MQVSRMLTHLRRLVIPMWAIALTLISASLMVSHWVTLPHPQTGETVLASGIARVSHRSEGNVIAFHFLYGDCPCSRRVLKQVIDRKPMDGVIEHLVLIGEDRESQTLAEAKGFSVDVVPPKSLMEIYGVEAAPLLVVTDSSGAIRYSGGYTSRKQGLDIQDQQIIAQISSGNAIGELPLYGCAVSKSLRSIVDPLNLK